MPDATHFFCTQPAAVVRASGPDAAAFLQSQFTNDLRDGAGWRAHTYGLWLDRKGKIQADSHILRRGPEDFLLVSQASPPDILRGHLEAHLVADEVELGEATAPIGLIYVWGRETAESVDGAATAGAGLYAWPTWARARLYLGEQEEIAALAGRLAAAGAAVANDEEFAVARVRGGFPLVPGDAGPGDLPQETGLDEVGVSYTKGCYLGQEVMARLHTQGHVNRHLFPVGLIRESLPPGLEADREPVPLFAGEQPAGELRSRAGARGLAMLRVRAVAGRTRLSFSAGGLEAVVLPATVQLLDEIRPP